MGKSVLSKHLKRKRLFNFSVSLSLSERTLEWNIKRMFTQQRNISLRLLFNFAALTKTYETMITSASITKWLSFNVVELSHDLHYNHQTKKIAFFVCVLHLVRFIFFVLFCPAGFSSTWFLSQENYSVFSTAKTLIPSNAMEREKYTYFW